MTFKKGDPRPAGAGRRPGIKSKSTLYSKSIKEWFTDKEVHPVDLIMETIREQKKLMADLEPADQIKAWTDIRKGITDLIPYLAPRLKEKEAAPEALPAEARAVDAAIENASSEDLIKVVRAMSAPQDEDEE